MPVKPLGVVGPPGPPGNDGAGVPPGGVVGQVLTKTSDLDNATGWQTPAPAGVTSVNSQTGAVTLVKADVGLGSVDNTSDAAKPVSTAQQTALDAKAPLASPALTGTPTAPTAAPGTNTTQLATTAFVIANAPAFVSPLTAKGDLYGRGASADARIPVGADGQVLVADSTQGAGVGWQSMQRAVPYVPVPPSAHWVTTASHGLGATNYGTTFDAASDTLYLVPIQVPGPRTWTQLGIRGITTASASGSARLGVYRQASVGGVTFALAADLGVVSTAATGQANLTGLTLALNDEWVLLAFLADQPFSLGAIGVVRGLGQQTTSGNVNHTLSSPQTYGVLPATVTPSSTYYGTFGASSAGASKNQPVLHLR